MAKKRITELATETTLKDGQYVAIDHTTDGTKKLNLGAELTALKEDLTQVETDISTLYDMGTLSSYNNDKVPYLFRASGGGKFIGGIEKDTIVGVTVPWNQLIEDEHMHVASSSAYTWSEISESKFALVKDHKYLVTLNGETVSGGNIGIRDTVGGIIYRPGGYSLIYNSTITTASSTAFIQGQWDAGTTDAYLNVFDLTLLLGSTIADYIYSLETATAGAGVAKLKSWGFFTEDYYPYDSGSLKSVESLTSHDMVGFNQFDINNYDYIDNSDISNGKIGNGTGRRVVYIPCFPNTTYCASRDAVETNERFTIGYTEEEPQTNTSVYGTVSANTSQTVGNRMTITTTTGANAKYLVVWAYWNNMAYTLDTFCINLSWDGERDGEYEPYIKHSYPLDSSVILRGVPKQDDNGELYYDGDRYLPDGTVERRYGEYTFTGQESCTKYTAWDSDHTYAIQTGVVAFAGDNSSIVSSIYPTMTFSEVLGGRETGIIIRPEQNGTIYVSDPALTSQTDALNKFKGTTLTYKVATITTEQADPYQNPQIVDKDGTEEYVTTGIVPVGHDTDYYLDADSVLTPPSTAGTYSLKVTVASDGSKSYSWVSD